MQFSFQRAVFQTQSDKQIKDTEQNYCVHFRAAKIAQFYLELLTRRDISVDCSGVCFVKNNRERMKKCARLLDLKHLCRRGRRPFVYAEIPRGKRFGVQR
jgi:hypothetical protein